jgi:acetyltransferase-like isoleucine patch superfamily enzyme
MLVPSCLKLRILKYSGSKIGKNCRIGFSYIDVKELELGSNVYIGNFNIIKSLNNIELKMGSKIESFNWITGGGMGELILGENSSIRRFHFLEASGGIEIGHNTIIAGRGSHFFTHGLSPTNLDQVEKIIIGNWNYLGSSLRVIPGVTTKDYTFVGMGSVLTKKYNNSEVLIAGNPAIEKKKISKNEIYFNRLKITHSHHKSNE